MDSNVIAGRIHCQFYANNLHHTAPQGKTGYFYYFFKKFRENARNCILLK